MTVAAISQTNRVLIILSSVLEWIHYSKFSKSQGG